MIKRIIFLGVILITGVALIEFMPTEMVHAYDVCEKIEKADSNARKAAGCNDKKKESDKIAKSILGVMYWVIFTLAVVMMIVGGLMYVLSAGDPSKIQRAKNTILVSVIGLIIATLASAIINFVINSLVKGGE